MRHDDSVARIGTAEVSGNPFTLTYSGKVLYFLEPTTDMVDIEDVIYQTCNLCRFTGATSQFYSVGQHSVFVSYIVEDALRANGVDHDTSGFWDQVLAGLLHDAEETYTNDLSSPFKSVIGSQYAQIADGLRATLFDKYGVGKKYKNKIVKDADNVAIMVERFHLMPDNDMWPKCPAAEMKWGCPDALSRYEVREMFRRRFNECMVKRDKTGGKSFLTGK